VHDQHERLFGDEHDGREVVDGVVERLFVEGLIVGLSADRAEQNLIAIRTRDRHALRAVHPACPADIFDDHLLAKDLA